MFIYLLIAILFICLSLHKSKDLLYSILFVIILCVLVFSRGSQVGTDVEGYSLNFKHLNDNPLSWNYIILFEPGFNYLVLWFKKYISSNPMNCWGTLGIIYTISFFIFAKKYTKNRNIAILLFYLLGTYFLSFNIMRQCFAFSFLIMLFSFINIQNINIKKAILFSFSICITAILFHPTIYIFLLLLLFHVPFIQKMINKRILIILLVLSYIVFYTQAIIPFITSIIGTTSIEGKLINYATSKIQGGEDSGFSLLKISLITLFQIYIILISKEPKNIFLFSSTLGVIFLNCFGLLVVEFARVYELLAGIGIIYLADLWDIRKRNLLAYPYKFILITYACILFLNILSKNYGEIVPYVVRF